MTSFMAEFESPEALTRAIVSLRQSGHKRLAAYTPYPISEVEEALELRPSWIPLAVLFGGLFGVAAGFALQWFLNGANYPLLIGGFHPRDGFAFIPITFESMILSAVLTAVGALLVATGLPRLWHPVFEVRGFESATRDGFWLACEDVPEDALRELAPKSITAAPEGVA